jgi:hypothetical protein
MVQPVSETIVIQEIQRFDIKNLVLLKKSFQIDLLSSIGKMPFGLAAILSPLAEVLLWMC